MKWSHCTEATHRFRACLATHRKSVYASPHFKTCVDLSLRLAGLRWRQRKYQLLSSKLLNYKLNFKFFRSGATIPSLEWLWSNAWVRCCVTAAQLGMMHKRYSVWTGPKQNQCSACLAPFVKPVKMPPIMFVYLCWLCSLIIGISRSNKHGSKLKLKLACKMCNGFNLRHTM